jgi:hypothetical protein
MNYPSSRVLSATEYSYLSAKLIRRAALVLGFSVALIFALLLSAT